MSVVVTNRDGGAGSVGTQAVATARGRMAQGTGQVIPFLGAEDSGARLRPEHAAAGAFLRELGPRPR